MPAMAPAQIIRPTRTTSKIRIGVSLRCGLSIPATGLAILGGCYRTAIIKWIGSTEATYARNSCPTWAEGHEIAVGAASASTAILGTPAIWVRLCRISEGTEDEN